jgi:hypothetical protein
MGTMLASFHETVWTGRSNCSACKRASGHEEIATCAISWVGNAFFAAASGVLSSIEAVGCSDFEKFSGATPTRDFDKCPRCSVLGRMWALSEGRLCVEDRAAQLPGVHSKYCSEDGVS